MAGAGGLGALGEWEWEGEWEHASGHKLRGSGEASQGSGCSVASPIFRGYCGEMSLSLNVNSLAVQAEG